MMLRPAAFRAALLVSAACLPAAVIPGAARAQTASPTAAQAGTGDVIRVLLDQAAYWRSKNETALADEALTRVLALDPGNIDALAAQAQAAVDRGDKAAARTALGKLQAVRPDDPRIASIRQALDAPPIDRAALAEARSLATAGKSADAVAAYRRAFHSNTPPPSLALEYYESLDGVDGNWDEAREGLAAVVRTDPQNLAAQLAFAQAMTYHEGTRADGVDRLMALTSVPDIADAARLSWHNAMLWSGDDERTKQQLATYLQRFPGDPQLDAKRAEIQSTTPDEGTKERLAGYEAMETHNLAAAEPHFVAALNFNKDDVFAMSMLAVIRNQQGKVAEAKALVARIKELAPDRQDELLGQTGLDQIGNAAGTSQVANQGAAGNAASSREAAQAIRRGYEQVGVLVRRGEFSAAEGQLRRLMGPRPNAGNYLLLGDIQLRAGRLAEAEASFRTVLRSQPRNVAALGGLAGALSREGKTDEANALYARAGTTGGASAAGATRATQLREQAQNTTDPDARISLFRQAIAADGANPWLRLELARTLIDQGKQADARQVMDPVTEATRPTTDQLRSSIYYAESTNNWPLAASLVQQLPAKARTADLQAAEQRGLAEADLRDARAAGSEPAIKQRMLVLAAKPDPTGARGAAFAQDLIRLGDKPGARDVIRAALNGSQAATPQQRLAYSGALIAAGYPRDASVVSALVQPTRLTPVQRTELASVQNSAAVVASDQLNGKGQAAEAYDQLAPRLARDPQNADLNLALARLYAAQKDPRRAAAISEAVSQREPNNVYARISVLNAQLQQGETRRATELGAELKRQFPDEPQAFVAAANAERANGDQGQALRDLRTALALRSKQIATTNGAANPSSPGA